MVEVKKGWNDLLEIKTLKSRPKRIDMVIADPTLLFIPDKEMFYGTHYLKYGKTYFKIVGKLKLDDQNGQGI